MIVGLLAEQAARTPDAPLAITADGTYSYADMLSLTRRFAGRLQQEGIVPGDHVALIAGNSAAFLVAWWGICAAGAVAVTLNNQLVGETLDYTIAQSDSKLIVADRQWIDQCWPKVRAELRQLPLIAIESERALLEGLGRDPETQIVQRRDGDLAGILYTSGTTGSPKGVMEPHGSYIAVGAQSARLLSLKAADRTMIFMPLFHTNPQMYAVMSTLTVGASLVIRPKFSAQSFFDDARRFGATGFTFVGTVLAIIAARYAEPQRDHALRFCIGGGTTKELCETIADRFGFCVYELYGMTEIGGWVSGNGLKGYRVGSCGRLRDDVEVKIFDEHDEEMPVGGQGEIVVRPRTSFTIFSGYYKNDEETTRSIRNLWFHTGDIGRFDEDGYLYFQGRSKELIRRGGEMIAPAELEQHLRKLQGVQDCAVVGVEDAIMGEEIKAVLVGTARLDVVRPFLANLVPRHALPRYAEIVDHIPKTETEKILRRKLQYLDARVTDLLSKQ
jgi:acyl-CoA synthetase (AMP-forming)/AMP-acid ligase II